MIYTPLHGLYDPYDCDNETILPDEGEYFDHIINETFHITHLEKPIKTMVCRACGGTEFNIGSCSYTTYARCIKCQWEICIHSG